MRSVQDSTVPPTMTTTARTPSPPIGRRRALAAMVASAFIPRIARGRDVADAPRAIAAKPALRASGRHFLDPSGRVVVLRGINLAGDSKVPPFVPSDDPADLDRIAALGFNCLRLLVVWEALEPCRGSYDWSYLDRLKSIVSEAGRRGLYVILDFHQDGFSRFTARGSGDGFPRWAVSPRARPSAPDNGPKCADWPLKMASDLAVHKSFNDFFSDAFGVRTRYLIMVRTVARAFASEPSVIGYDLLNEPWGDERTELAPLYRDASAAIRAEDPSAMIFVEGHVTTNCGLRTKLPRPGSAGAVYSPHYYKPSVVLTKGWHGGHAAIDLAFAHMRAQANEWCVPLFVSEFGAPAGAGEAGGDYIAYLYDRLDDTFASGAQWNLTPHWDPVLKDGWNGEDFSISLPSGAIRPNFRPRPFPRAIAGEPRSFRFVEGRAPRGNALLMSWFHRPELGETEVFLPPSAFPPGTPIATDPIDATTRWDPVGHVLAIRSPRPGLVTVRINPS